MAPLRCRAGSVGRGRGRSGGAAGRLRRGGGIGSAVRSGRRDRRQDVRTVLVARQNHRTVSIRSSAYPGATVPGRSASACPRSRSMPRSLGSAALRTSKPGGSEDLPPERAPSARSPPRRTYLVANRPTFRVREGACVRRHVDGTMPECARDFRGVSGVEAGVLLVEARRRWTTCCQSAKPPQREAGFISLTRLGCIIRVRLATNSANAGVTSLSVLVAGAHRECPHATSLRYPRRHPGVSTGIAGR